MPFSATADPPAAASATAKFPGGRLYVIGTPIGNLGDLSRRALEALRACDAVACESLGQARKLLALAQSRARLISYREANRQRQIPKILGWLRVGWRVGLVTDAGTPGFADPGRHLAAAAFAAGFPVVPIPGPSAVAALWSVTPFGHGALKFAGFPPARKGKWRNWLAGELRGGAVTIFFVAPHDFADWAALLAELGGHRQCLIGRELTKIHEQLVLATCAELPALAVKIERRGEFTMAVEGLLEAAPEPTPAGADWRAAARQLVLNGLRASAAAKEIAGRFGVPRREVYGYLCAGKPG